MDAEQLAAASVEERARALENERKWAARDVAASARERALYGDAAAAAELRSAFVALLPADVVPDEDPNVDPRTGRRRVSL